MNVSFSAPLPSGERRFFVVPVKNKWRRGEGFGKITKTFVLIYRTLLFRKIKTTPWNVLDMRTNDRGIRLKKAAAAEIDKIFLCIIHLEMPGETT